VPQALNTDHIGANRALPWYLASAASYLLPGGIQVVLFPWLVAVYLLESPERLGLAQMSAQIPAVFLILVGGLIGDRFDQRRILLLVHLAAALPPWIMAWLIGRGDLSYALLILYALTGGAINAISQPARDALLNRVAGDAIQRTVTLVLGINFGIQIVGFGMASLADTLGPAKLMLIQGSVVALGVFAVLRLPPAVRATDRVYQHPLKEIAEGLSICFRSPRIRPAWILTAAVGVFFVGTYIVLIPLIIRDIYHGNASDISLAFACNMLGTILTTAFLVLRGGIHKQGRALLLGLFSGSLVIGLITFNLPYWAFFVVIFLWGIGGGITMSMSRAIVQESAPKTHRARVMSVYSLAMLGGMPFGSLLMGYSVKFFGPLNAVLFPAGGVMLTVLVVHFTSSMWQLTPLSSPGFNDAGTTPETV